jgi:hypothetical protein
MNRRDRRTFLRKGLPVGALAVENAWALRGLVPWPNIPNPIGDAALFAVRSHACEDCGTWADAVKSAAESAVQMGATLADERPATVEDICAKHTSPNAAQEPATDGLCAGCKAERAWYVRHGFGAPPSPRAVMQHLLGVLRAKIVQRDAA